MPLERCFAPAILPFLVRDLDEQPSRRDAEIFDVLDPGHDERRRYRERRRARERDSKAKEKWFRKGTST